MNKHETTGVIILGAGFAGLQAAFSLRQALPSVRITVIAKDDSFLYRPDSVYVPFGLDPDRLATPILAPLQKRNIEFVHSPVSGVDVTQRRVTAGGRELPYDYLVIAIGAQPLWSVPGLDHYGYNVTSTARLLGLRLALNALVAGAMAKERRDVLLLAPPGVQFAGPLYELALLLDTWLYRQDMLDYIDITVTTWEDSLLQSLGPQVHDSLTEMFHKRHIEFHTGWKVGSVQPGRAQEASGEELPYDVLITTPALVGPSRWPGLNYDDQGFIRTDVLTRRAEGQSNIFVAGDAAGDQPFKQAYLAFSQADVAAHHIACDITGEVPTRYYQPRSRYIIDTMDSALYVDSSLGSNPARVAQSRMWHLSKQILGRYLPWQVQAGEPFSHLFERNTAVYKPAAAISGAP